MLQRNRYLTDCFFFFSIVLYDFSSHVFVFNSAKVVLFDGLPTCVWNLSFKKTFPEPFLYTWCLVLIPLEVN